MQAVLLCGALNDGLGPVEQLRHVPTLPVANTPLIHYSLGLLQHVGVTELTVNVFHGADNMERIVRELPDGGMGIRFVYEHRLIGSANVLRRLPLRPDEPFLVMMGDIFFDRVDVPALLQAHRASGAAVTLLASKRQQSHPAYGLLSIDGRHRLTNLSKEGDDPPDALVNTGFYVVDPAVIDQIPGDKRYQVGRDLLPALVMQARTVLVVEGTNYYQRVNSFRQYWRLSTALVSGAVRSAYQPALPRPRRERVAIDPTARLDGAVVLGDGCHIARDVVIRGPAVIGGNVMVGRGSQLEQVVVLPNTALGLATRFQRSVLFGKHVADADNGRLVSIADPAILHSNERPSLADTAERLFHSALALILLLLLSPLLLLVALAIRLESPGPICYTQLRVGQRRRGVGTEFHPGQVFELVKFRSMYVDADERLQAMLERNEYHTTTFVKFREDPRVTRVGRFIRKTSIDELPQLINVVRGDMRLVGNRPLPLYEAEQLRESWQQVRFSAPAGMTGLWQVSGRSDLSLEERIVLDNYYAVSRSFSMDMRILCSTVPAVLLQRGSR